MIKIKDDIDLEELKKFGFEKTKEGYSKLCCRKEYVVYIFRSGEHNRYITVAPVSDMPVLLEFDILYDLIQAGLVEKVDDE